MLFTFWEDGKKTREVTLQAFVADRSLLQETASHFYRGFIEGIDAEGRLVVKRADEKRLYYDLATGRRVD